MRDRMTKRLWEFLRAHTRHKRWRRLMLALSCVVVFCTTYALILPGITLKTETYCGAQSHQHTAECYTRELSCGRAEHTHTDECYAQAACTQEHEHDGQCGGAERELICAQAEHTHTDECYTERLHCAQAEHTHTLACYSNPSADLETAEQWEKTLPQELSGDRRADLVRVARSQEGYEESAENYEVQDSTCFGYTRYGAWYGLPYADWCAMYVSFCLNYAQVPETVFPRSASCDTWQTALEERALYEAAADYSPEAGDVVFLSTDDDGEADQVGIVAEVTAEEIVTLEGNADNAVRERRYARGDTRLLGYGVVPEQTVQSQAPSYAPQENANGAANGAEADPQSAGAKPKADLELVHGGGHGADGTLLFYTGETLTARLGVSDSGDAQTGEGTTVEDDGTVVRVYMRFSKAASLGSQKSADGAPALTSSGHITATGSGRSYAYSVRRIESEDSDHYTYCFELARPLAGDTISIDLPCAYPSPTSAGGAVEIWSAVLTREEKEALDKGSDVPGIQEPENGASTTATWETVRNDFTLSKYRRSGTNLNVYGEGNGIGRISLPSYEIRSDSVTGEIPEGIGEDFVTAITYTDVIELPEGLHFADEMVDAINNKTYSASINYSGEQQWKEKASGKTIFAYFMGSDVVPTLKFSEGNRKLTVKWTYRNQSLSNSKITLSSSEIGSLTKPYMLFPQICIENLEPDKEYSVRNEVTAAYRYSWSTEGEKFAEVTYSGKAKPAALEFKKGLKNDYAVLGSMVNYWIHCSSLGGLAYEELAFVEDTLPTQNYISANGFYSMFSDSDNGKKLTATIFNASICESVGSNVVCTDGKTAATTKIAVESPDTPGKYDGLWTQADPFVLTERATITVTWNADKTALIFTRTAVDGVPEKSVSCPVEEAEIQAALDELGLLVTNRTQYRVVWDMRDEAGNPLPIPGGKDFYLYIYSMCKSSFMLLEQDRLGIYSENAIAGAKNTAYAFDKNGAQLTQAYTNKYNKTAEFRLSKSMTTADGTTVSAENAPTAGDMVDYAITLQSIAKYNGGENAAYDVLPLTDHMSGPQTLLAEVEANKDAVWAEHCETYTDADGVTYYRFLNPGRYSGVWLGGYYADSVEVTESDAGLDTVIKWYFSNYGGKNATDTVGYRALICPADFVLPGTTAILNNESWLNDHVSHRLYAPSGLIPISTIPFNKRIVQPEDVEAEQKESGLTTSIVGEGETVYYRMAINLGGASGGTITLTGSDLRDSLPLGLSRDGTDYLKWQRGQDEAPGSVWVVGYQGGEVVNGDHWSLADSGVPNRQELLWEDDFSVTFPADGTFYIYVRLTFPAGADWQAYAAEYSLTPLENTFYLNGIASAVTHGLKVEAKAYLQKGVYANTPSGTGAYAWAGQDLTLYKTYDGNSPGAVYYVILYNAGQTRLYLTDMQDILPYGYSFVDMHSGGDDDKNYTNAYGVRYGSTISDSPYMELTGEQVRSRWRRARIEQKQEICADGRKKLTFRFRPLGTKDSGTMYTGWYDSGYDYDISYDAALDLCYLNPGEAISFGYKVRVPYWNESTEAATNSIAMPYYDYNGGGVDVEKTELRRVSKSGWSGLKIEVPNDGDCTILDNAQAVASGRTGGSDDTQWLYSEVTQYRGEIKPGIGKRLSAAVKTNGAIENSPIAAHPEDTLRWEITAYNDGTNAMEDYILTDTVQSPYRFTGTVTYKLYDERGSQRFSTTLFTLRAISGSSDRYYIYGYKPSRQTLIANGEAVTLRGQRYSSEFDVRLTQDSVTGNLTLAIHIPEKSYFEPSSGSIPPGGKAVLTLDTVKADDAALENTVYINTAYLTPMSDQGWDGTTNRGNVVSYDPWGEGERLSVRTSAPVVTAYGFATSSRKDVEQTDDPNNRTTCNETPNYIVLPDADTKNITYTLNVDAPEDYPMASLVFIDTLPYIGDHTAFQQDDLRFSQFHVDFAADPSFSVTVTADDGTVTTLSPEQYSVAYSDKTEFDREDWNGSSVWNTDRTAAKSVRIIIHDENAIPQKSHVAVRFNAVVGDEATYGQIAWNSFGYHYSVRTGSNIMMQLEAAPLTVGVMMPNLPEIRKRLVDEQGTVYEAQEDASFRFLLHTGAPLTLPDNWTEAELARLLAAESRDATTFSLTVRAGEYRSEFFRPDAQKVQSYADGAWTDGETDWSWVNNRTYTLIELPPDNDLYTFDSIAHNASKNGYSFIYQSDRLQRYTATNRVEIWDFTVRKTDETGQRRLSGAWFALYSPSEADRLSSTDYDALTEKPSEKPAETLDYEGKTYYLTRVAQTQTLNGADGTLVFGALTRAEYLLQEFRAPAGYVPDGTVRLVRRDDASHEMTVVNQGGGISLPESGSVGLLPYTLGGTLLAAGSLVAGLCKKRKRKGGREQ